ncbi:MAG: malto-oligosyltrehalose synthase [Planctomycetes bacterium]|nr:malto-oligosyltrehalose synthase [Planctomycetota bacterium]
MTPSELLDRTFERIAAQRRLPESTYRLQLHAGFTFRDAEAIVPYLHSLGITHCYTSPYLQSRPGSLHGYDITNHAVLNAEIGSVEDFEGWVKDLHDRGMGQILDVVPNHMGIAGNANAWWNDVLENGPLSSFAGHFDIAWEDSPRPELYNRVLLPVLSDAYGKVLEAQQLQLVYDDGFAIQYFEHRFPLAPLSYAFVLEQKVDELERLLGADAPPVQEYRSILTALSHLPGRNEKDSAKIAAGQREKEVIKRRLTKLVQEYGEVRDSLHKAIELFNGRAGEPASFNLLDELLDRQAYRLSFWRVASDEINYRRFFDINELAALNMERLEVFTAAHELVFRLLSRGKLDGVRIDHIDGLYDPRQYLQRLQQYFVLACAREILAETPEIADVDKKELEASLLDCLRTRTNGSELPLYVVVEKILGSHEDLPGDWEMSGASGYDFAKMTNGLFIDRSADLAFQQLYRAWINDDTSYSEIIYQKKFSTLHDALSSELHMLGRQLDRIAQRNRFSRDFTQNSLRFALRQILASFPVYRFYIADDGVKESDRFYVESAIRRAIRRSPTINRSLFHFIRDMLLLKPQEPATDDSMAEQRRFAGKFQQVTAPVTAKGVEDTAFYVYNRLLSLNEVGGDPSRFGVSAEAVHRYFQKRQSKWPRSLSPLSTHDTKRSEDVRARLNVLSEFPDDWHKRLVHWNRLNEAHRGWVDDSPVPDANEEYFLYQTLLGAWPLEPCSPEEFADFVKRLQAYMSKALHEAKVHSSWINPNDAFDEAMNQFVARILDEKSSAEFLRDFREFQSRINHYGMFNSLAQTLLKIASPGVPDTYQGTELWDFSLVDPDNRRPVDYAKRQAMLQELDDKIASAGDDRRALVRELVKTKNDGRIKLFLNTLALRCRRDHPGLFSTGEYLLGETAGKRREHAFAFARRNGTDVAVVIVPRFLTRMSSEAPGILEGPVWEDTQVLLPDVNQVRRWKNVFTGEIFDSTLVNDQTDFSLEQVLADFPVALLIAKPLP